MIDVHQNIGNNMHTTLHGDRCEINNIATLSLVIDENNIVS